MPQPPRSTRTTAPQTAEETAAQAPPVPAADEQAFRVDQIGRYLEPQGFKHYDIAGAFSGIAPSKKITIAAAAKRVKAWLHAEQTDDSDLRDEDEG